MPSLEAQRAEGADPEDPDEYRAVSIFWVLKEARWSHLLFASGTDRFRRTVEKGRSKPMG